MGPILSRAETSKVVDRTGSAFVNAASCCVNGFRVSMEDAHCMTMPQNEAGVGRYVFGVFDGHSNETCSAFVAEALPPEMLKLPKDPPTTAIEDTFIGVDKKYMENDKGGGTTAAVAMLDIEGPQNIALTICNTGDSRVMIIRNNEILTVTEDHKPSNPAERERIERANGMVRMNRVDGELAVSRAFGDSSFKRTVEDPRQTKVICVPEMTRVPLQPGDLMMIACDGVFEGNFSNEMVCEFTSRMMAGAGRPEAFTAAEMPLDLGVVAAAVCDQAIRRGSKDNISCMLVQIGIDGRQAASKFGAMSFVPGPPPLRNNTNARTAFEKMARMANLSVGQALQRRFELLKDRAKLAPPRFSELDTHAFDLQDSLDMDGEERYFGSGPPEGEENVLQWFDDLTSS